MTTMMMMMPRNRGPVVEKHIDCTHMKGSSCLML